MGRAKKSAEETAEDSAAAREALGPPPWNYSPRDYQRCAFDAMDAGVLRQFLAWHRRAGKDTTALALSAKGAHREIGTYWHLFPKQTQARRAIWHGINREGRKFVNEAFPEAIRTKTRDQEMMLELACGSTWQMAGSDNYDTLVGSNVRGVVFSEWALCDPAAWPYIMPILLENGGWAIFITTFRGKNHAWRMFQDVREFKDWHCSFLTIDETRRPDGSPVVSKADVEKARRDGMDEPTIREEFFLEPQIARAGSYYGRAIRYLEREGRLAPAGYEPGLPLYAAWHSSPDALACILVQKRGTESRIVSSHSWRFTTITDALEDLREQVPFARHIRACITQANARSFELAGYNVEEVTTPALVEGIETVRRFLPTCRIDTDKRPFAQEGNNLQLIDSLNGYRTESTKHTDMFASEPSKTWETFLADAVLTWAMHDDSGASDGWGRRPNYAQRDRGVI